MKAARELADEHWNYVWGVVTTHEECTDRLINIIAFHYKTAFIHGFKHGEEHVAEKTRQV